MFGASKASCRDHQCMGIRAGGGGRGCFRTNREPFSEPMLVFRAGRTCFGAKGPEFLGQRRVSSEINWEHFQDHAETLRIHAHVMQRQQDAGAQLVECAHTGMHVRVACAYADFCWDQQASSSFPAFHRRPWGEVGSFVGLRRWACRPCIVAIPHDQYPLARPRSLLLVCLAVDSTRASGWQRPQAPFGQDIQQEQQWAVGVHRQPEKLGVGQ